MLPYCYQLPRSAEDIRNGVLGSVVTVGAPRNHRLPASTPPTGNAPTKDRSCGVVGGCAGHVARPLVKLPAYILSYGDAKLSCRVLVLAPRVATRPRSRHGVPRCWGYGTMARDQRARNMLHTSARIRWIPFTRPANKMMQNLPWHANVAVARQAGHCDSTTNFGAGSRHRRPPALSP